MAFDAFRTNLDYVEKRAALVAFYEASDGAQRAAAEAAGISPAKVVDTRPLQKAMLAAALALLVGAGSYLAAPGVFRAVLPRFFSPTAGHPAFTLVKFDIRIEPAKVYRGWPAVIHATLSGPTKPPDQANVVFLDEAGREGPPLPMLHAEGGKFSLRIERADRSRDFYVATPAGRSRRHRLTVHAVPTFQQVRVRYEFPGYTCWPASSTILGDSRDLAALAGTRVSLTVKNTGGGSANSGGSPARSAGWDSTMFRRMSAIFSASSADGAWSAEPAIDVK